MYFAWSEADGRDPRNSQPKAILKSRELSSSSSASDEKRFVKHSINFLKIWNSEQESKERCNLCRKQVHSSFSFFFYAYIIHVELHLWRKTSNLLLFSCLFLLRYLQIIGELVEI